MQDNKKYIIEIEGKDGQMVKDAAWWERNKDSVFERAPKALVYEVADYDENDSRETDQYLLGMEGYGDMDLWDSARWERNKDQLATEFPNAVVKRVRYIDYWGDQKSAIETRQTEIEDRLKALRDEDSHYLHAPVQDAPVSSELTAPVSEPVYRSTPATRPQKKDLAFLDQQKRLMETNPEYASLWQEKNAIAEKYEQNPYVIAQREAEAEYEANYLDYLENDVRENMGKAGLESPEREQFAFRPSAPFLGAAAQQASMFHTGDFEKDPHKAQYYADALNYIEAAKGLKEEKEGFGQATYDVAKSMYLQPLAKEAATAVEIWKMLDRLEEKYGDLNDIDGEKIEETLTDEEKSLLLSYFAYNSALQDAEHSKSVAYKAGEIFGRSIPFMLEFVLTGGVSKLGAELTKKASKGFINWILRKTGKVARSQGTKWMLNTLGKGATKLLTNIAPTMVGETFRTVAQPTTYFEMLKSLPQYGEDGHLHVGKNMAVSFADRVIENFSEASGELLLGAFGKAKGNTPYGKTRQFLSNLGFQGLPAEIFEEIEGAALRELTGVDTKAFEHMFDTDNFAAMVIGFAPMTMIGATTAGVGMTAATLEMNSAAKRIQKELAGNYSQAQIDHALKAIRQTNTPNEAVKTMKALLSGAEWGNATGAQVKALWDYGKAVATYKSMFSEKQEMDRAMRDAKAAEMEQQYGKYWQEQTDAEGNAVAGSQKVSVAILNDGRKVFMLETPNEQGEFAIKDRKTGAVGFAKESDIKTYEVDGENVKLQEDFDSIDNFVDAQIMSERKSDESVRMEKEKAANIEALKAEIKANNDAVVLGTEGDHRVVYVKEYTDDGVVAYDEAGNRVDLTWQDVSNVFNMGQVEGKSDEQLMREEIDRIVNERGGKKPVEKTEIPRREDGSIDEDAFWNQSPEAWAEWNDKQNNDNGADTYDQILSEKASLEAQLKEVQKQKTSAPFKRREANRAAKQIADRLARLTAMEEQYAERFKTPEQKRADMIAKAKEIAKRWQEKWGITINIIEDKADITYKEVKERLDVSEDGTFAWTDLGNKVAEIYMPNITSVEQFKEKVAHEVVSHIGLRALLGEKYNSFLERVWGAMSESSQKVFYNYAAASKYKGLDRIHYAADEYVAHIAERMGVEALTAEEQTFWQKLLQFLKDLFSGDLFKGITENEIINNLKKSYQNLESGQSANADTGKGLRNSMRASSEYEALAAELTPEEIAAVASNDLQVATQAYETLLASAPKVEQGETSKAFVERKRAHAEQLKAAKEEMEAKMALMDEVNRTAEQAEQEAEPVAEVKESVTEEQEPVTFMEVADEQEPAIRFSVSTEGYLREQITNYANSKEGKKAGWTPGQIQSVLDETGALIEAIRNFAQRSVANGRISEDAANAVLEKMDKDQAELGGDLRYSTRITPEQEQSDIRFSVSNENQAIFVSNAAKAVEGIQMGKATPEQWFNMLTKNGGLKAAEDKWLGLSDWLKASDKKSLTKDEVLQFINENKIQIEEVHYSEDGMTDDEMFETYIQSQEGMEHVNYQFSVDAADYAREQLEGQDLYDDEYEEELSRLESEYEDDLYGTNYDMAVAKVREQWEEDGKKGVGEGERMINETRLDYTTEGLENKHEIALTIPTIEPYEGSLPDVHFFDAGEGRAVAWIRFGETSMYDRKDNVYKDVLVIDEIQSQRHQDAREKGYTAKKEAEEYSARMNEKYGTTHYGWQTKATPEEYAEYGALVATLTKGVPSAPFEKNWHELAMKRMLRYAAENGYDAIAWTKGEQQAGRYNIGGVVKDIYYVGMFPISRDSEEKVRYVDINLKYRHSYHLGVAEDGLIKLEYDEDGEELKDEERSFKDKLLADVVGKEAASQIMQMDEQTSLTPEGLKVGGEGMKGFYDKMLPSFMNKYGKKWGVKVSDMEFPNLEDGLTMHSIPVTEEMKESVMQGQLMFSVIMSPADNKYTQEYLPNYLFESDIRFSISKNNKQTITNWLNKRNDLSEKVKEGVMEIIEQYNDATTQLCIGKWFSQGTISLPEDLDNCLQAVASAKKAKVNALSYANPMEIINEFGIIKSKKKPVDPDAVSTLKRAKAYDNGIVIYDVEESEESRKNLREIINTHYGVNASPWCLLQGDENGNLTKQSATFWENYSAVPKRVVFKNGKLLAFFATSSKLDKVWWDRLDRPWRGVPVSTRDANDPLKREVVRLVNERTGRLGRKPAAIQKETRKDNGDKTVTVWRSMDANDVVSHTVVTTNGETVEGFAYGTDARLGGPVERFTAEMINNLFRRLTWVRLGEETIEASLAGVRLYVNGSVEIDFNDTIGVVEYEIFEDKEDGKVYKRPNRVYNFSKSGKLLDVGTRESGEWQDIKDKETLKKYEEEARPWFEKADDLRRNTQKRMEEIKSRIAIEGVTGDLRFSVVPHESSMDEVDGMFKQYNGDPFVSDLYGKVSELAHTMGLKISFAEGMGRNAGLNALDKIKYNVDYFNSPDVYAQDKAKTLLHELIHSVTRYAIYAKNADFMSPRLKEAVAQLESIYEEIKDDPAFEGMYGITSVEEMVSELANVRFRAKLREKNLLQKVVDAIKHLLGIDKGEKALDNLSATLEDMILNFDRAAYEQVRSDVSKQDNYIRFSVKPEVRAEMDGILANAMVDGLFERDENGVHMLAPNGKRSNLDMDTWAMVRTKNFKNWFGDWENDPENASKVVDENGEPMVMYHGSAWEPLVEPKGKAVFRMNDGLLGKGAYFSNELAEATLYAEMATGLDITEEGNYELLQDKYVTDYFLNVRSEGDIFREGNDMIAVAKSPSQIKSIHNNGEFSESGDIRFSTSMELDERFGDAWRNQQNEDGRHSTQVANTKSTYEKIGNWMKEAGLEGKAVLDASSGLGLGTQALREMGFEVDDVEPFPSENREAPTFASYDDIDQKYDVVISNAVLNVIPDDWREDVLRKMASVVKDGGKIIINTRPASNISKQGVEGKTRITLDSPSEILVKRGDRIAAYQKGFTSEELADWIKSVLGEGWRVEKATKKNSGISGEGTAVVVKESAGDIRFSTAPSSIDIEAVKGLQLFESMGYDLEGQMKLAEDSVAAALARIKYWSNSKKVGAEQGRAGAQHAFEVAKRQMELLRDVQSQLIDVTYMEPAPREDDEPQNIREYIAQMLTGKNGSRLTPETLEHELGWSAADRAGMKYIVSSKGMSVNELAELIMADAPAHVLRGMESDDVRNEILDFLQSVRTYAEIRDYMANARMAEAKAEADQHNADIDRFKAEFEAREGMTVEQYNEMVIQQMKEARDAWLASAENPAAFTPEEEKDVTDVPSDEELEGMTVEQIVNSGKQKMLEAAAEAKDSFMERVFKINARLDKVRAALAAQREYDQTTAALIADMANEMLENGALSKVTRAEIKRIVSAVKNAVGKQDITPYVDRIMDVMIGNQLRNAKNRLNEFLKIKGKKVNSSGVEVQGKLDIEGQGVLAAMKKGMAYDMAKLESEIAEAEDRLFDSSQVISRDAANELAGLYMAQEYMENIKASEAEEVSLRDELDKAQKERRAGRMSREAYREYEKSIVDAVRENRMQRVTAYENLLDNMAERVMASIAKADALREADKARVERIRHFANSDMEGMPADILNQPDNWDKSKAWLSNNDVTGFLFAPAGTFNEWMKRLAPKSRDGHGYLWNHFMGGWVKAADNEWKGTKSAYKTLDARAKAVFGDKVKRWSDIFAIADGLPAMEVKMYDGDKLKTFKLGQGNCMYIYMVNKMSDGKMKLRRMGITEEDVDAIVRNMDSRLIDLADWLQESFLPSLREKYNAVHEKLFGAPMAAIENYFPLKVHKEAIAREEKLGIDAEAKPSTITGAIIKRTKNSAALDLLNANAIDVILGHIEEMEHWAAFAEWTRDLNTLLSYRLFRTRIKNMNGILGSGEKAWRSFRTAAEIAAEAYKPEGKSSADRHAVNLVKGATSAAVSARAYTAFKQLLSAPAFVSGTRTDILMKCYATPVKSWNWAIENLPLFDKRWLSRKAGDSRLMDTDADWQVWKNKVVEAASRIGMTPNALIDAVTVACGARAVYETKMMQYQEMGYTKEQADEKAKIDAAVAYNETQQSSEAAFLSQIQKDRTYWSAMATAFRNSSMGYQRKFLEAMRKLAEMSKKGYKEESIEYMKKMMMRDGLTEEQAQKAAEKLYRRSFDRNLVQAVVNGFVLQFFWILGPKIVELFIGDDDDWKEIVKDAAIRAAVGGWVEGLVAGPFLSELLGNVATGQEDWWNVTGLETVAGSDIETMRNHMKSDKWAAINDLVNLFTSMIVGFNPQNITDAIVSIWDACEGDLSLARETTAALMRVLQFPQSNTRSVIASELDLTDDEMYDMTVQQFAERYARYNARRSAGVIQSLILSDETMKEREEKYIKQFIKEADERRKTHGSEEAQLWLEYIDTEFKEMDETLRDLKRRKEETDAASDERDEVNAELGALKKTEAYDKYKAAKKVAEKYEAYKEKPTDIKKELLIDRWNELMDMFNAPELKR